MCKCRNVAACQASESAEMPAFAIRHPIDELCPPLSTLLARPALQVQMCKERARIAQRRRPIGSKTTGRCSPCPDCSLQAGRHAANDMRPPADLVSTPFCACKVPQRVFVPPRAAILVPCALASPLAITRQRQEQGLQAAGVPGLERCPNSGWALGGSPKGTIPPAQPNRSEFPLFPPSHSQRIPAAIHSFPFRRQPSHSFFKTVYQRYKLGPIISISRIAHSSNAGLVDPFCPHSILRQARHSPHQTRDL